MLVLRIFHEGKSDVVPGWYVSFSRVCVHVDEEPGSQVLLNIGVHHCWLSYPGKYYTQACTTWMLLFSLRGFGNVLLFQVPVMHVPFPEMGTDPFLLVCTGPAAQSVSLERNRGSKCFVLAHEFLSPFAATFMSRIWCVCTRHSCLTSPGGKLPSCVGSGIPVVHCCSFWEGLAGFNSS